MSWPGFVDIRLRLSNPPFELHRTQISQAPLEPLAIVEAFNKRKDSWLLV